MQFHEIFLQKYKITYLLLKSTFVQRSAGVWKSQVGNLVTVLFTMQYSVTQVQ